MCVVQVVGLWSIFDPVCRWQVCVKMYGAVQVAVCNQRHAAGVILAGRQVVRR